MEFPFKIELSVNQDDFIAVDILEQQVERETAKKDEKKSFIIKMSLIAALSAVMLLLSLFKIISVYSLLIPALGAVFIALEFALNYSSGIDMEFSYGVSHLLTHRDTNEFFTPETGTVEFFEDRCELLTNEQRRLFDYSLIKHIKITAHLYIFVMKRSREKMYQGFAYMVIPKRILLDSEIKKMNAICQKIVSDYHLSEWTTSDIMG